MNHGWNFLLPQCASAGSVDGPERVQLLQQKGITIWLTGLSASGKVSSLSGVRYSQLLRFSSVDHRVCAGAASAKVQEILLPT